MTRRIIIFIISWLTCVILWCPITTAAATPSFDNEHDEHEEAANQQQQQQQQGRRHSSLRRLRHTRSTNTGQPRARDLNHEVLADNIDIDGTTRVMVQCQDWTMAKCLDEILNLLPSAVIMHQLDVLNSIAIQLPATFNTININSIMADFPFEMQPDPIREPLVLPHSLRILQQEDQEYLQTQQVIPYGLELLAVPQVWSKTRGADVTVCIMDTGLDLPHPDLSSDRLSGSDSNDVVRPWTQDAAGHGTHVAGTIGASDNGVGVLGVAPDADLFIVRVFNYNGVFRGSDVIAAAEQCRVGGATVINMSLGGTSPVSNEAKLFQRYLEQEGIVAVAAAGNSGHQGNAANYPAGYPSVLSVAAVDYQGQVAHFSTRNNQVNVAAPGVAVLSTYKNGQYAKLSGTSMASPHVAGVVALLQSVKPQATPTEIWELLTTTASLSLGGGNSNNGNNGNGNSNSRTPEMGYGIVNVQAAMDVWFPPPQEEEEEVDTNSPTTIATDPPTTSPPATPVCGAGEQSFVISITTDYYGSDTEWELETIIAGTSQGQGQGRDQVVVLKGGPYPDAAFDDYVGQACVQADNLCYKITVYDVFGDGICCNQGNGGFAVTLEDEVLLTHPFNDFLEESRQFGNCPPPPGAEGNAGTDPPVTTTPPDQTSPPETTPPETTPPETTPPCADIQLEVLTDNFAGDTSYELRLYSQNDVEQQQAQQQAQQQFQADDIWYKESGTLQNMVTYQEEICVDPQLCYQLGIFDSFGDGMLGAGSGVRVVYDGTVKFEGKDFGFGGYILMGGGCPGN